MLLSALLKFAWRDGLCEHVRQLEVSHEVLLLTEVMKEHRRASFFVAATAAVAEKTPLSSICTVDDNFEMALG